MPTNARPSDASDPRPVAPLEVPYERQVPWSARRGPFYLIVFLLFLNVLATTSITWGPSALHSFRDWREARQTAKRQAALDAQAAAMERAGQAKKLAVIQQCLATTMPSASVIYTEDPVEATSLLRDAPGYSVVPLRDLNLAVGGIHPPVVWQGPESARQLSSYVSEAIGPLGTIFLHERHTSGGPSRLVWVRIISNPGFQETQSREMNIASIHAHRELQAGVFGTDDPATGDFRLLWFYHLTWVQPPGKEVVLEYTAPGSTADLEGKRKTHFRQSGDLLRVFAGRVDPTQPDHLTIDYTLEGKPGSIDVILLPDNRLRVETHQGEKITDEFNAQQGDEHWNPHAK